MRLPFGMVSDMLFIPTKNRGHYSDRELGLTDGLEQKGLIH